MNGSNRAFRRKMRHEARQEERDKDVTIERLKRVIEAQRRMIDEYESTIKTMVENERKSTEDFNS